MPRVCRLIVDGPAAGPWNMALDEALAEWSGQSDIAVLRFYAWAPATLSLGYFQTYDERLRHEPSLRAAVVRRASGGGAILHDDELTYSLALPGGHALAADTSWLYTAVHGALIDALAAAGVSARTGQQPAPRGPGREPFLCFRRRAAADVLVGEEKICGSAQRRRSGALLQHGSLVLRRSPLAPEIAGLADYPAVRDRRAELVAGWSQGIGRRLDLQLAQATIEPAQHNRALQLAAEKYGQEGWTRKR